MKTFFKYHWYAIKNFYTGLSVIEFMVFAFAACLASIIVLGILFSSVKLFVVPITSNIQMIKNVFPQILCFAVLLSRLFIQSEKTLDRIFNSHNYYVTLPIERNSILNWSLIVNFLRDGIWSVLGIILTIIIAHLCNFNWLNYFGQTIQLIVLWTTIGGLISFASLLTRIVFASHIQFENKFALKLLTYAEVMFSILVLLLITLIRYIFIKHGKVLIIENYGLFNIFFSLTIIILLYLIITKLFSKYEKEIKKYFEIENDYYSVKEMPVTIDKLLKTYGSPLTQNILKLTLATRSYGFTKVYSLVVISMQAIILLLFSLNISEAPTSVIVFIIAAVISITMSFSMIFAQLPFLFTITRSLPVSFREVTQSFFKGGLLLSMPVFIIVMILSIFLGLSGSLIAISISLLSSIGIVLLRMFIAFQYPYSRILSDFIFIVNTFIIILFFPLILIVLYHYKKAHQLWNKSGLL